MCRQIEVDYEGTSSREVARPFPYSTAWDATDSIGLALNLPHSSIIVNLSRDGSHSFGTKRNQPRKM